eukprot:403358957
MRTSPEGAINFQQCPFNAINQIHYAVNNRSVSEVFHKISLLEALETDLNCASMCGDSRFYTFSNVTKGPPLHNCTTSANMLLERVSYFGVSWCSMLALLFIAFITNQLMIICKDTSQYIQIGYINQNDTQNTLVNPKQIVSPQELNNLNTPQKTFDKQRRKRTYQKVSNEAENDVLRINKSIEALDLRDVHAPASSQVQDNVNILQDLKQPLLEDQKMN